MRFWYVAGLCYLGISAFALLRGPRSAPATTPAPAHAPTQGFATSGAAWFADAKPYCNTLEVASIHQRRPPPTSTEGVGYSAACWALAARIDEAREAITTLADNERYKAVGIVFNIGHPIADMGDDRSAGPIMELVVEYWPNHYMALYHAGAAQYALKNYAQAERHLTEFLKHYHQPDGWTGNAKSMLQDIAAR